MGDEIDELGKTLLEHKYRYYELDNPIITDYEFDMLEKNYVTKCQEAERKPNITDMVGFDSSHRWAKEIKEKVNND